MNRTLFTISAAALMLGAGPPVFAQGQGQEGRAALARQLQTVYLHWREAMVRQELAAWQAVTASHRQISIRNRIFSERRALAAALFSLPAAPPDIRKLKLLDVKVKGSTANAIFFGPVDFEVGVAPPDNLLVLSFANEGGRWKYDTADYVNLAALPDVRQQLAAGELKHLSRPEFMPTGAVERPMVQLRGPVKHIAKTYVYCPGREVQMQVNTISRHLYQNTKDSEVVIGGAKDGRNEVQYAIKALPGGQGTEPMTIRVYLMSEVPGVKPVKVFEYQVAEGEKPEPSGTKAFLVGPEEVKKLGGGT